MQIHSKEFKDIENELNISFQKFCTIELLPNKESEYFYSPQKRYNNIKNIELLEGIEEDTEFCKFKPNFPKIKGVYIWVFNNEIVYIGEGVNLNRRFNIGYGHISPRNCYVGGQSTNIKMNRFVVEIYKKKQTIDLYYYETENHKSIEKLLLDRIKTIKNKKNNI